MKYINILKKKKDDFLNLLFTIKVNLDNNINIYINLINI